MMNCSSNHLRICKFIKEDGRIVKPCGDAEFHIIVESCSQRRYYVLNKNNCFCVELEHLCNETYCVYEEEDCEYDVCYEVDGVESTRACVDFNDQDYHHIKIINHTRNKKGNLTIKKRVFDICGKEIVSDDSFQVKITGDNYSITKVLGPNNNFEVTLNNLKFGTYVVSEMFNDDYDVSYLVDGVISDVGTIMVDCEDNLIEVLNHLNNGIHYLRICKWISKDGKLVKPDYDKSYTIRVKDDYAYKEYTLECCNHFCICLEGDKNDVFTLEELDVDNVVYEVNGEEVREVVVTMNQDHDVRIINMDDTPCPGGRGNLTIQKWIEQDGRLSKPTEEQSFSFYLHGYSDVLYVLDFNNDFTLRFEGLEVGYYQVEEMNDSDYLVVYDVNGTQQEMGYVYIEKDMDGFVNIINQVQVEPTDNIITIIKRVDGEMCGELTPPSEGSFEIFVKSPLGEEYYTLDMNNDYEVRINAVDGDYVIYELNPTNAVSYRLDGVDHFNEVVFFVNDSSHEVMVINHINKVNYVI